MSHVDPSTNPPAATVEVDTDHAAEDVWSALTSDEGLERWMGEGATIEPEVGGAIDVPDPATGRHRRGQVDHLEADERINFTWWPIDDPDDTSVVQIELQPTVDGTRIRVTETATASIALGSTSTQWASGRFSARSAWAWRTAILVIGGVGVGAGVGLGVGVGACRNECDRIRA